MADYTRVAPRLMIASVIAAVDVGRTKCQLNGSYGIGRYTQNLMWAWHVQERTGSAGTPRTATPRGRSFIMVLSEQQHLQKELVAEKAAREAAEARALIAADEAAAAVGNADCHMHSSSCLFGAHMTLLRQWLMVLFKLLFACMRASCQHSLQGSG